MAPLPPWWTAEAAAAAQAAAAAKAAERRVVWVLSAGSFLESTTWMLTMQAQTVLGLGLRTQVSVSSPGAFRRAEAATWGGEVAVRWRW